MLVDSTLVYPYTSILNFYPHWIEENKTSVFTLKWKNAIVSFFAKKEFNQQEFFLIGSGFLYLCGGKVPCIVTASHVITDMKKSDFSFISIDGMRFPFEKLEVFFNHEQDYAFIPLPNDITSKIPNSRLFTSTPIDGGIKTSSFLIIGYPAKYNNLHKSRPDKGLQPLNLTFHNFFYERESEDIFFHFIPDGKKKNIIFEPISAHNSVPSLSGMSGGVIAQIVLCRTSSTNYQLYLRAIGIFKEHRAKRGNYLVGATFIDFADEINTLIK